MEKKGACAKWGEPMEKKGAPDISPGSEHWRKLDYKMDDKGRLYRTLPNGKRQRDSIWTRDLMEDLTWKKALPWLIFAPILLIFFVGSCVLSLMKPDRKGGGWGVG
jgi:hypothetical protein